MLADAAHSGAECSTFGKAMKTFQAMKYRSFSARGKAWNLLVAVAMVTESREREWACSMALDELYVYGVQSLPPS